MNSPLIGKFLLFTFLVLSCSYHEDKQKVPDGEIVDGSKLNFQSITSNVFRPRCYSCHSADKKTAGLNLEDYAEVKAKSQKIKNRAVNSRSMPPNTGLGDNNAATLGQWIDAGTPND